jgi:hypothetical protein
MSETLRLKSEDVIINAPMSYAGAAQRAFRLRRKIAVPVLGLVVALLVTLLWWSFVTGWYLIFGLLLFPYRILRRGARKRKKEALQHREMLNALQAKQAQPQAALGVAQAPDELETGGQESLPAGTTVDAGVADVRPNEQERP